MTKYEDMVALRNDPEVHYNCAQSVLIPFAQEAGLSRKQAADIAARFGGGMGCGCVCGALTGALMVMGAMEIPEEARQDLYERFQTEYGSLRCEDLVNGLEPGTPERKQKCDRLIAECLEYLCCLTEKE